MNRRQFIVSCAAAASAATMPGCALRPRCDRLFWYNASSGLHIPCDGLERPLRVWQVSDSHLNLRDSRDDEYKDFYARMGGEWNPGLTAREAFERILEKAKGERPDLLLVTGDLISFPTLKNVEFAVERLDACGVPWLYTAGNHDWHFEGDSGSDAEQRERWIEKRLLPLYKGEDPMAYAKTIGGVKFLMIDNSTYNVDERQLEFFRAETAKGGPCVLAMHIPFWHRGWGVFTCACPDWGADTDKYWQIERRQRWAERQDDTTFEFRRATDEAEGLVAVLAGHLHKLDVVSDGGLAHATAPLAAVGDVLKVTIG